MKRILCAGVAFGLPLPAQGFSLLVHGSGGYESMSLKGAKSEESEEGIGVTTDGVPDPAGFAYGLGVTAEVMRFGPAALLVGTGLRGNSVSAAAENEFIKFETTLSSMYLGLDAGVGVGFLNRFRLNTTVGFDYGIVGNTKSKLSGSLDLSATTKIANNTRIVIGGEFLANITSWLGIGVGATYHMGKFVIKGFDGGEDTSLSSVNGYALKAIVYAIPVGAQEATASTPATRNTPGQTPSKNSNPKGNRPGGRGNAPKRPKK